MSGVVVGGVICVINFHFQVFINLFLSVAALITARRADGTIVDGRPFRMGGRLMGRGLLTIFTCRKIQAGGSGEPLTFLTLHTHPRR